MGLEPIFSKNDEDKTREELAGELEKARADITRLKKIIAGQQKIIDIRKTLPTEPDELEVRLECTATVKEELDGSRQELEALNEELRANVEELSIQNNELLETQETLRGSEEKFRALTETSPAMVLFHQGGKFLYANPAAEAITGYSHDELLDMDFWGFIASDDRYTVKYRGLARLRGENPVPRYPVKILTKRGEERWIEISSARMEYRGKLAIMVTALDVTARKHAEGALRENEQRLALALSAGRLATWDWHITTGEVVWSDEHYRMMGYEIGGVKPSYQAWVDRIHPEDRPVVEAAYARSLEQGGDYTSNFRVVWPDGSVHWVEDRGRIDRDAKGQPTRSYGVIIDTTEDKQAQEALLVSEARLAAIIHGSPVPQFVIDRDHHVVYWNKAIEQYTGIKSNAIVGTTDHWKAFYRVKRPCLADLMVDGAHDEVPELYGGKYSKSGLIEDAYEATDFFPKMGKGGKWLYFTATVIKDHKGDVIGAVETLDDITERKRAEEAQLMAKQQAELYLDLMGHDINNLHQIALGYLELAREMPPGNEQVKFLDKPVEVLHRSAQLISNVRKLQKIHDGVFRAQEIDVCQLLTVVLQEFGGVPNKTVTLNLNGREDCHVRANELLHEVYANLVSNAIKHTGDKTNINLGLVVENDNGTPYCRVAVEDNGPGIPDDHKDTIFNRKLKGTDKAKGMGLGLFLVKSLVDSYGGRVWVEDRVKGDQTKGARFVVLLPAVEK